jgi:hypothetical protein
MLGQVKQAGPRLASQERQGAELGDGERGPAVKKARPLADGQHDPRDGLHDGPRALFGKLGWGHRLPPLVPALHLGGINFPTTT